MFFKFKMKFLIISIFITISFLLTTIHVFVTKKTIHFVLNEDVRWWIWDYR